jgi:ribokinase
MGARVLDFFHMQPMDFLAIGDTVIDDFIRLHEATVHCDVDNEHCTISMRWGDKIPFESSTVLYGVGNSANGAVAAARLGLSSGLISDVGSDDRSDKILEHFVEEKVDTSTVAKHEGMIANYHYVLWYESERTILIKHEEYPRQFPASLPAPKTLYLSSVGSGAEAFHDDIAAYCEAHPETFLVFQPGTFQMKMGTERLAKLYARTNFFIVNKEEAQRILNRDDVTDFLELAKMLSALGPKLIAITDGTNGAYAYDGTKLFRVPMYPDVRGPFERTGAGDAFASSVAAALTLGRPFEEALLWGPINSMSVVQEVGAQKGLLTRAQIEDYLAKAPAEYKITEA